MSSIQTLDSPKLTAWPALLLAPQTRLRFSLHDVAGRFRAPTGWGTETDLGSDHLVYGVPEGRADVQVDGEAFQIASGDLLWIGPGRHVRFAKAGASPLTLLRFRFQLQTAAGRAATLPGTRLHQPGFRGMPVLEALVRDLEAGDQHSDCFRRAQMATLVTTILRQRQDARAGRGLTAAQRARIEKRLATDPRDWPTPRELAELAGLTPDYFARQFRAGYGMAPRDWLVRERVRLARLHLRETTRSIGEIAELLGYADVFHFSKQYKAVTGLPPSRDRQA